MDVRDSGQNENRAQAALLELSTYLDGAEDADMIDEVPSGRVARGAMVDGYAQWLQDLAPWRYFFSLTLRPATEVIWGREYERPRIWSEEAARSAVGWLVHNLNRHTFGASYKRVLKAESYFSQVWFAELQEWGASHWHGLTTGPIHMQMVHQFWGHGFAWVVPIESDEDTQRICRYLAKYVGKGGLLLDAYKAPEHGKVPLPTPSCEPAMPVPSKWTGRWCNCRWPGRRAVGGVRLPARPLAAGGELGERVVASGRRTTTFTRWEECV